MNPAALLAAQTRVLEKVAADRPLPETLETLVRAVEDCSDGLLGSVLLVEDGRVRTGAAPSLPKPYVDAIHGLPIGPKAGSCGTAAHEGRRVIVSDIAVDPLWEPYRHVALPHGLRACWSEPILSGTGEVLGTFALYYKEPRAPGPAELELISTAAHLASIALDRHRSDAAAREGELKFRQIADHLPQVIWLRSAADGALLFVSAAYERVWGRPAAELSRDPRSWLQSVHPEDRGRAAALTDDCVRAKAPREDRYRIVRPDGALRWLRVRVIPILDAEGSVQRVAGIAEDATEDLQAQAALRTEEERLRLVIRHTPGAIAMFDREMRYLLASPRWLSDYKLGDRDVVGKSHYEIFPGIPERWKEIHRRCLAGAVERCEEDSFVREDGSTDWIRWEIHPWRDPAGAIGGIVMFTEVITPRKKAEEALRAKDEQLRQAQKMEAVGRLAGGVAHDFNNLLTAIIGFSDLAAQELGPDHPQASNLRETVDAARRAAELTRQLLQFSRQQVLDPRVVEVGALLRGMDRLLRRVIGEDVELVVRVDRDGARVRVDPGAFEQALVNLAVNARDAMPRGGKLTLETVPRELDAAFSAAHPEIPPGPYVMIAVSDTGVGMDAATRSRIFEPFFTTKEKGKGTGLGLPMVFGFVKQSGGHVFVYSEPGQGAAFKIYLPRVRDAVDPLPSPPPALPPRGTETILLVEDDALVRRFAVTVLRSAGYTVLEAPHPEVALEMSREHPGKIEMLLTDVVMPVLSGRELADRLLPRRPGMKVLYMSGYTEDAIVHHGRLDPGTAFLAKPFSAPELLQKLRSELDAP